MLYHPSHDSPSNSNYGLGAHISSEVLPFNIDITVSIHVGAAVISALVLDETHDLLDGSEFHLGCALPDPRGTVR